MKRRRSTTHFVFVLAALLLATPTLLPAYVDPGSGSFFLQMLIAGLLGASVTLKTFWKQIKSYFSGNRSSAEE
jgi:hypothetical protein